jgi:hypothetical protein
VLATTTATGRDPPTRPGNADTHHGHDQGSDPPFIAELRGGSSDARPVADPLATVCASGNHHALIEPEPFMLERRGEYRTRSLDDPMSTLTANDTTKALITPPAARGTTTPAPSTRRSGR